MVWNRQHLFQLIFVLALAVLSLAISTALSKTSEAVPIRTSGSPANLSAIAVSVDQVELSWSTPTTYTAVIGYAIYRNDTPLATVNSGALIYIDTSVQPSTTYTYTIAAISSLEPGFTPTSPVTVRTPALPDLPDTTPPSPPESLEAVVGDRNILLSWYDASDDTDVTAYRIRRDGKTVATVNSGTLSYTDTGVLATTVYSYTVEAMDVVGHHSAPSNLVAVLTPAFEPDAPPSIPADLTATVVDGQIALAWSASTDDAGVTGYSIDRNGTALITVGDGTLSYTDTQVLPATTYSYTVEALDAAGHRSGPSLPAIARTPGEATTPPKYFWFLPMARNFLAPLDFSAAIFGFMGAKR